MTEQQPSNPPSDPSDPFVVTLPDDPASRRDWYLWAAVIVLLTLVAYWPAVSGKFIWDDDRYVTQNRALLDWEGFQGIWHIPPDTIQYYPLTFTVLWIEHHFWALNSTGYRVVNILLHAGAALVLWRILRRLAVPGAWVAAVLWAVHPLQAESVSWISELKNVLSGLLAFGSILFYLEFAGLRDPDANDRIWNLPQQWQTYAISLALFVLAMFSKTVVCAVPVILFIILCWKHLIAKRTFLGLVPMLIVGALLATVTSALETAPNGSIRATGPQWDFSLAQRFLISGHDFWFYIGKLLLPIQQSFIYPRHVPTTSEPGRWIGLILAIALIAVLALGVKKFGGGPLAAVLCYLVALFPALGFFNVLPFRYSFVADHFQYLAGAPLIVLFVAVVARLLSAISKPGSSPAPAVILAAAALVLLGIGSWNRAGVLSDPSSVWEDVLDKNPDNWLASYNLAKLRQGDAVSLFSDAADYLQGGDPQASKEAAADANSLLDDSDHLLNSALAQPTTPDDVRYKAYDQIAENDITRLRSLDADAPRLIEDAAQQLALALAIDAAHDDPLPYYTLGMVHVNRAQRLANPTTAPAFPQSRPSSTRPATAQEQRIIDASLQAQRYFQLAIDKARAAWNSPTLGPDAQSVLPLAALERGHVDFALASYAHDRADNNAETQYAKDGVADYALAVRLNPTNVEAHYRLALCLERLGNLDGARAELLLILRDLDHRYAPAYNEIGRVILASGPTNMGDFEAAVESFHAAIEIDPNFADARKNLVLAARMLASTRPATKPSTQPASIPSP
jgi:tetratricopeptide (TPR) repeat protein